MMPNSPNLLPPIPPNITIKKIPIQDWSGFNKNWQQKKSKRNCDTKQQTEALSQPLSSLSKNMVVKTVSVIKQKISYFVSVIVSWWN